MKFCDECGSMMKSGEGEDHWVCSSEDCGNELGRDNGDDEWTTESQVESEVIDVSDAEDKGLPKTTAHCPGAGTTARTGTCSRSGRPTSPRPDSSSVPNASTSGAKTTTERARSRHNPLIVVSFYVPRRRIVVHGPARRPPRAPRRLAVYRRDDGTSVHRRLCLGRREYRPVRARRHGAPASVLLRESPADPPGDRAEPGPHRARRAPSALGVPRPPRRARHRGHRTPRRPRSRSTIRRRRARRSRRSAASQASAPGTDVYRSRRYSRSGRPASIYSAGARTPSTRRVVPARRARATRVENCWGSFAGWSHPTTAAKRSYKRLRPANTEPRPRPSRSATPRRDTRSRRSIRRTSGAEVRRRTARQTPRTGRHRSRWPPARSA